MKTALIGVLVGVSLLSSSAAVMPPAKKMPQHNFSKMKSMTAYVVRGGILRAYNEDESGDYILAGLKSPAEAADRLVLGQKITSIIAGEDVWVLESEGSREIEIFRKPDGMSVNLEVVRLGWAEADADDFKDNRENLYRNYEARARHRYVGIWEAQKPTPADHSDEDETVVYEGDSMYHKYKECGKFKYVPPQGYGARGFSVGSARRAQLIPCPKCKPAE